MKNQKLELHKMFMCGRIFIHEQVVMMIVSTFVHGLVENGSPKLHFLFTTYPTHASHSGKFLSLHSDITLRAVGDGLYISKHLVVPFQYQSTERESKC